MNKDDWLEGIGCLVSVLFVIGAAVAVLCLDMLLIKALF